jgi:hypothetical protein
MKDVRGFRGKDTGGGGIVIREDGGGDGTENREDG